MSPTTIFLRLMEEADGDVQRALQHACGTIYELSASVSCGYMRAKTFKHVPLKPAPPFVDLPPPEEAIA